MVPVMMVDGATVELKGFGTGTICACAHNPFGHVDGLSRSKFMLKFVP